MRTPGSKAFAAFLKANRISQADAARALGVSSPTIFDWIKGTKRPRPAHREAIERWTEKVVADQWKTKGEREGLAKIAPLKRTGTDG